MSRLTDLNSVLGLGQVVADEDGTVKIGDGRTGWNDLKAFTSIEMPKDEDQAPADNAVGEEDRAEGETQPRKRPVKKT